MTSWVVSQDANNGATELMGRKTLLTHSHTAAAAADDVVAD